MSISVEIKPLDDRCRYWAKIIRDGVMLPMPGDVTSANDIPGPYIQRGEEELFPGDILIEGEANHHRMARGWTYHITACKADGTRFGPREPKPEHKAAIKAKLAEAGLNERVLAGSGDIAACVRIGFAVRSGIEVPR